MTPTLHTEPLVITKPDEFPQLLDRIHDEHFGLEEVQFDPAAGVVDIPYRRIFHGDLGRLVRNWILFRTYEVDVIQAMLTIRNVEEYTVDDRSRIGTYSFNTASYADGALLIQCCEDLDFRMVVPELDIECRDLETRGKTRITQGLFWSSNTSKVYE